MRIRHRKTLVAMWLALACSSQRSSQKSLPILVGSPMPCRVTANEQYIVASAQTAAGCEVVKSGIRYFVATINGRDVAYVSTNDTSFQTPEGLRVGDDL